MTKTISKNNFLNKNRFIMKKLSSLLSAVLLLSVPMYFYSCSKSSDNGPTVLLPKLEGYYVYGTNTVATQPTDQNARLALAVLDHTKKAAIDNLAGVYGKLMYIGANSTINFAVIDANGNGTVYGADKGGSYDSASVVPHVNEKDKVVHGTLKKNGQAINITEEGLYYTFLKANTDTMTFIVMKLRPNITGDYNSWGNPGYALSTLKFTSVDSTVFEGTNIPMKAAFGYRYRYNNGWAVYEDDNSVVTLSSLGVADYGASWAAGWNDIGLYNDNIPQHDDGLFTVRLSYKASDNSWKETKIKTAELPIDYTNANVGLEGNAYVYAPQDTGAWKADGTDGYELKTPTVSNSGKTFTWTWANVSLIEGREFIFLQDATWGHGLQLDGSNVTLTGTAIDAGDIVDATTLGEQYHNLNVVTAGAYDIILVIDQSVTPFTKTVTINEHQ